MNFEEAIMRIQEVLAEAISESAIDGILLDSELLLRDVAMVEELLPAQDAQL